MKAESSPFEIETVHREPAPLSVADDILRQATMTTLAAENVTSAEISLVLTDDAEIHRINLDFLGHDYATDVISFLLNDDEPTIARSPDGPRIEGELIISVETAERAARERDGDFASELVLYVVHGLLHLCGYDDQTELDRAKMRRREADILSRLALTSGFGIPAPADHPDALA